VLLESYAKITEYILDVQSLFQETVSGNWEKSMQIFSILFLRASIYCKIIQNSV
jgi:hypothetical protein